MFHVYVLNGIRLIPFKKYYYSFSNMNEKLNKEKTNVLYLVSLVTGQTDYDNETALDKLSEYNYDPIAVIRDFMGPKKDIKTVNDNKTLNQRVYQEMRSMLDTANAAYREKKDKEEEEMNK
jgi:hypothetical protein